MLNHIHLIAKSNDMIGFVRDFKTFTSKELNPVRKGYVGESEHWVYSSANRDERLLELDSIYR